MPSNLQQALLECGCGCGTTCCTERCNPYISELHPGDCTGAPGENPLPSTLTVEATSDSPYGCWSMTGTVTLIENGRWGLGTLTGTCTFCCYYDAGLNCTWTFCSNVNIQCGTSGGWLLEWAGDCTGGGPLAVVPPSVNVLLTKVSCNPILLTGESCYNPGMACIASIMPPLPPVVHPTLCFTFTVYETL